MTTPRWARALRLRERLLGGIPTLGIFCKSRDPAIIEVLGDAGYHFAIVDLDHSSLSLSDVEQLVRAADAVDLPVLVRLGRGGLDDVGRVLDSGAAGIQMVGVESEVDASSWRAATRYFPDGTRGLSFSHRAARFGAVPASEYLTHARIGTTLVAQIESTDGIAALPELLASDDLVDALFLGPVDLAANLGHAAESEHADVQARLTDAARQILAAGVTLGIFCADLDQATRWAARGATMIVVGTDLTLTASAARKVVIDWAGPPAAPAHG